jgi:hypothetical protein
VGTSSKLSFKLPSSSLPHTSCRNMIPAIPLELSDIIFDFLHNNVAALCSAGLVCKSWLPASRFHLFSEIQIRGPPSRILELICAEGSTIPHYILHLRIAVFRMKFVDETLLRLPLLSNLKSLSLSGIDMARLSLDAKKRLNVMLRKLRSLCLSTFTVRNCFSLYSLSNLRYSNSLKPLIKRLILLRPPLVWRILA